MKRAAPDEIRLISDSLALCDVRCGPTEDKVIVRLSSGVYKLAIETHDESVAVTIRGKDVEDVVDGAQLGEVSIDGGVLGAYDPALFSEVFGADAEGFYDWGESLFEAIDKVRVFSDAIEPYEFAYIPTGLDGVFLITELTQGDCRVGVRLTASFSEGEAAGTFKAFQFYLASPSTTVEVWLNPDFDDESILDSVADSLEDVFGRDVEAAAVETFVSEIESVDLAVQIDEKLFPRQSLELSSFPANWNTDSSIFCENLRKVMLGSQQ